MLHFIETHGFESIAVYWVFSAAVGAMQPPKGDKGGFYGWAYRFTHAVAQLAAANLKNVPGIGPLLSNGKP